MTKRALIIVGTASLMTSERVQRAMERTAYESKIVKDIALQSVSEMEAVEIGKYETPHKAPNSPHQKGPVRNRGKGKKQWRGWH